MITTRFVWAKMEPRSKVQNLELKSQKLAFFYENVRFRNYTHKNFKFGWVYNFFFSRFILQFYQRFYYVLSQEIQISTTNSLSDMMRTNGLQVKTIPFLPLELQNPDKRSIHMISLFVDKFNSVANRFPLSVTHC